MTQRLQNSNTKQKIISLVGFTLMVLRRWRISFLFSLTLSSACSFSSIRHLYTENATLSLHTATNLVDLMHVLVGLIEEDGGED